MHKKVFYCLDGITVLSLKRCLVRFKSLFRRIIRYLNTDLFRYAGLLFFRKFCQLGDFLRLRFVVILRQLFHARNLLIIVFLFIMAARGSFVGWGKTIVIYVEKVAWVK